MLTFIVKITWTSKRRDTTLCSCHGSWCYATVLWGTCDLAGSVNRGWKPKRKLTVSPPHFYEQANTLQIAVQKWPQAKSLWKHNTFEHFLIQKRCINDEKSQFCTEKCNVSFLNKWDFVQNECNVKRTKKTWSVQDDANYVIPCHEKLANYLGASSFLTFSQSTRHDGIGEPGPLTYIYIYNISYTPSSTINRYTTMPCLHIYIYIHTRAQYILIRIPYTYCVEICIDQYVESL